MYAVVRSGGKQYRVAPNDRISVEKLVAQPGETITLDDVLMVGGDGAAPLVGAPMVDGATVSAEVLEHIRGDKILIFKKKRRKNHRRLKGHRQSLTVLRITRIEAEGFEAPISAGPESQAAAPAVESEAVEADAPLASPPETAAPDAAESTEQPKE